VVHARAAKIAVYSGLLTKLDPTDEELAAVMGTRSPALREHGRERASEQVAQQLGSACSAWALGLGDAGAQLTADPARRDALAAAFRVHETEADRIGCSSLRARLRSARRGFSLWQKMGKSGGGKPARVMSNTLRTKPGSAIFKATPSGSPPPSTAGGGRRR